MIQVEFLLKKSCRSVHNICIEWLWVDVTKGFGSKWKAFFQMLESNHGFDVDKDTHIWLVHFLFLGYINADADAWMQAWNPLSAWRETPITQLSILYMVFMVLEPNHITQDTRHIVPEDTSHHFAPVTSQDPPVLDEKDQMSYGIDWDEFDVTDIIDHHRNRHATGTNQTDPVANPFLTLNPADILSLSLILDTHLMTTRYRSYQPTLCLTSLRKCVAPLICRHEPMLGILLYYHVLIWEMRHLLYSEYIVPVDH